MLVEALPDLALLIGRDGVVLAQGGEEMPLLGMDKVKPATAAQPDALLAAALAGWALDVPTDLICAGLRTIDAAAKQGKAQ